MSKVKSYDLDRRYPVRMAVSIHYLPDRSPMIKVAQKHRPSCKHFNLQIRERWNACIMCMRGTK